MLLSNAVAGNGTGAFFFFWFSIIIGDEHDAQVSSRGTLSQQE